MTKNSSQTLGSLETAGARCSVAAILGAVAGIVSALFMTWQGAILVGWAAAAICYLSWTWGTVRHLDPDGTKRHANIEDPSRRIAEAIVLIAGVALLAAVGLVLIKAGQSHGSTKAYLITVGIVSVVLSWATVHTVFMLRYTRSYYQSPEGGVDFNEANPPAYLDFAYLAFTIGMTFQVSDTDLTTKPIRRIALSHALMSYLFGALEPHGVLKLVGPILGRRMQTMFERDLEEGLGWKAEAPRRSGNLFAALRLWGGWDRTTT